MAENLDNFKKTYGNDLFFGEGPSNAESLLDKDQSSVHYADSTAQRPRLTNRTIDLTSIKSREGGFRANSIFTVDRSTSFVPHHYGASSNSGMNYIYDKCYRIQ